MSVSSEIAVKNMIKDLQNSVKLKFHPYRKPRGDIKVRSGLPEKMITTVISSYRTVPVDKLPPADEIEEFFASAEKELQKRFKDKYNYDIVNDTPLEGRFEWIQLKQ